MVDVPSLLRAVEALAWKRGCVGGTQIKHRVEPDGSHVITVTVPAAIVDQDKLPKEPERPDWSNLGASVGWGPKR